MWGPCGNWPPITTSRQIKSAKTNCATFGFLYLTDVKQASSSSLTIALSGIKFFYQHTLQRDWPTLALVRAPREKKLPVVLSVSEVEHVLRCVHQPRYRICLSTIYGCGLRLQEGLHLQVGDTLRALSAA